MLIKYLEALWRIAKHKITIVGTAVVRSEWLTVFHAVECCLLNFVCTDAAINGREQGADVVPSTNL